MFNKILRLGGGAYDPETGKIEGARYGSLAYFHEEGHKRQHESGRLSLTWMWLRFIMYFVVATILWELELDLLVFLMIAPEVYLEIDAWIYAFRKKGW